MRHPIHNCNDGVFNANSGKLISLKEPLPEMIDKTDIATGLSMIPRFGGQLPFHYSVAQHSVLVWYLAPHNLKLAALLHDAPEAYLGDVIKPLKIMLGKTYENIETMFLNTIFTHFGLHVEGMWEQMRKIKQYDMKALEIEEDYLFKLDKGLAPVFSSAFKCVYPNTFFEQWTPTLANLVYLQLLNSELFGAADRK